MRSRNYSVALAAIVTLCGATPSFGSDLAIVAVYVCDAQEINEATVKECTLQYPSLAGRASASWESWLKRNTEDIKKAKQQCTEEIQRQYTTEHTRDEVHQKIKQLKSEMLRSFPQMIKSQGEVFCQQYLSALESGENDLRSLLNKP
jgi:hypothetical protein